MKYKLLIAEWIVIVAIMLGGIGYVVYRIDPFMHYHMPYTDKYFYVLDNQRSQNDGIVKHFDYDALITGSSMTENFKTSEMDAIFGVKSIKVPYSGGSYKEINDNLKNALSYNPNLKVIVRCLEMGRFFDRADDMRNDLGTYPTYLYDNNPFNDVNYLYNRDIVWDRVYRMILEKDRRKVEPGITSFDEYSRWQYDYEFGKNTVIPNGLNVNDTEIETTDIQHLSEEERNLIKENVEMNITSLADEYPHVQFLYFFSPYSIAWWGHQVDSKLIYKQIEAEEYIIELILEHENIKLYSFNNRTDIVMDLNNYKDVSHYGQWVNTLMLTWMHEGKYLLTKDNYQEYLEEEKSFYSSFDYSIVNEQVDYEADFYAAALLNREITGKMPMNVVDGETSEYEIKINDIDGYDYLAFYATNLDDEHPLRVYDGNGTILYEKSGLAEDYGNTWHQVVVELDGAQTRDVTLCNENKQQKNDESIFRDIQLY